MVVAVAGNPNVGKSTVFNGLTGMKQHTGNWPGKTVACVKGHCASKKHTYTLVDLPGTYSLYSQSAEEEAAAEFLQEGKADIVVVVCDAVCLERNLNLVLQVSELGAKVVVCINMMDEAKKKGIEIDIEKLSAKLGIPVVGVTARKKKSLVRLLTLLDGVAEERVCCNPIRLGVLEAEEKSCLIVQEAEEICKETVTYQRENHNGFDRRLDKLLTGRRIGYPLMLLLLMAVFWITLKGAAYPSDLLAAFLFAGQEKLMGICCLLKAPLWFSEALVFGVYRVLAWVVSVMLPPMAIFFPLFTLLEDAGYLPRIAYNLDKSFKRCHACGKQALTMCMACVILQLFYSYFYGIIIQYNFLDEVCKTGALFL